MHTLSPEAPCNVYATWLQLSCPWDEGSKNYATRPEHHGAVLIEMSPSSEEVAKQIDANLKVSEISSGPIAKPSGFEDRLFFGTGNKVGFRRATIGGGKLPTKEIQVTHGNISIEISNKDNAHKLMLADGGSFWKFSGESRPRGQTSRSSPNGRSIHPTTLPLTQRGKRW